MIQQAEIDFTQVIQHRENNSFSESLLEANKEHLGKQCRRVRDLLLKGKRLTVKSAMIDYNISSLPRRILDLKRNLGMDIKTEIQKGGYAEYYL